MAQKKQPAKRCGMCQNIDKKTFSMDKKAVCYKLGVMLGDILAAKEVTETSLQAKACSFFEARKY